MKPYINAVNGDKIVVRLMRVSVRKRLLDAVKAAFDGDVDLAKYHIHPTATTLAMAKHTFKTIGRDSVGYGIICYAVYITGKGMGKLIGFTVIIRQPIPMLYSFGINHKFRTGEVLSQWLDVVKQKFEGQPYGVVLNQKNTRAIRFFEKNGYRQDRVNKQLKIVSLCPSSVESQQA